jgi:ATP-dependent Clp protease adaptor protein ClpS
MINWNESTETIVEKITKKADTKAIVVYNDDVNSFEWVIMCLVQKCGHSIIQAEQCTNIIHNNGKCDVKVGSYESLKPIHEALLDAGLNSKIM